MMKKIREYFKKYGLMKSFLHFLKRIGAIYKREYIFFETKLQAEIPLIKNRNDIDLDFISVRKKNFENFRFPNDDKWITKTNALRRLTERNCTLLALIRGNEILCYDWFEAKRAHLSDLDLIVSIPDDVVYNLGLYTIPDIRGKGLASDIKLSLLHFLKEQGYQKVFLIVRSNNLASQKVSEKCGFRAYQTVTYRRISVLKYYCVNEFGTNKIKRFLYIKGSDQQLWKAFSKIKDY